MRKQTGLPLKTLRRAVKAIPVRSGRPEYIIRAKGGDVSLKYFKARETRRGVRAEVGGRSVLIEDGFIRGGRFGHGRVDLNMGGHVFRRKGARRSPLEKVRSGIFIPRELTTGDSLDVFQRTVEENLPRRVNHELGRIFPGD